MQCPKCQFENANGMNFCGKCGAKLERFCPQCNFGNPAEYEFCGKCGYSLSLPSESATKELSFDKKLDKIQRYLPKGLTEKILSQRERIEGERKQVTVMFCDMESFTPLSEMLGIEETYSIMDQVYEILIHKVHDYGGTVNEMTGDGIMALFGAPIALEDAPQRSIRSAYAIHREMSRFSEKIKQERGLTTPIKMRIGIHTGPVVVGTLGNDLRVEFKAVGDTVNLASRMESLAEPGTTFATENTFKLTEGYFRFEALGEKRVKGKKDLVKVYQVIAPSGRRTRFDVSAERGLTSFVGRERELEILLDGFERAKSGRGQAFSIMAEAGAGKSRLLYEFRKSIINEDVTFLEGKCLPYCRGVAYHPIIDILRSNFDVQEGDNDFEIKDKAIKGLQILAIDESSTLPYLLDLLSVKDSGIDKVQMSPEAKKDRIMEAVKRITIKGSEIRPLIVATEDLHWIDKTSEEYLKRLLDSISGSRVFLILTYRPEYEHTWEAKTYHSQINLNRLSNRECLAMASYLLGRKSLENNLEEFILQKTEGIPFFIEEFIRSLKDLKAIERYNGTFRLSKDIQLVSIPSTIQDVIMARVDVLPEDAREVLQTGTVIGREFNYELIKKATAFPQKKLLSCLSILKNSELLYERGIYPESTYIFKHALTNELIYNSMLSKKKEKLHEKIGNIIEEYYKEKLHEQYEILAEHFIKAMDFEKGAEYSKFASKKSRKSGSFADAIAYGEKRSFCLERLPQSDVVEKQLIDARVNLGLYYNQISCHVKAKEAVEPVIELALNHGMERRISHINTIVGTYSFQVEGDYPKGFKYLENALKKAKEQSDFVSLWAASHWIGHAFSESCEFEKALYHLKNALEISQAANINWSISIMKSCMALNVYVFQGNIDLGYKTSLEGLNLAVESGDTLSRAEAFTNHGISVYWKGFLDKAEDLILEGASLCERINYIGLGALANWSLGDIYIDKKEYHKSVDFFKKQSLFLESLGLTLYMDSARLALARARIMNGERDTNLKLLLACVDQNKVKLFDGLMRRYISEIFLKIDDNHLSEAENWIKKAIEADKRNGIKWNLGRDYAQYAELFKRKGVLSKAKENFGVAINVLRECGANGWVEKYEKELVEL